MTKRRLRRIYDALKTAFKREPTTTEYRRAKRNNARRRTWLYGVPWDHVPGPPSRPRRNELRRRELAPTKMQ